MKRTERHQLKENEVAQAVARAKEAFEVHKQEYTLAAIGVVVVLAAIGGYFYWRQTVDTSSRAMLAGAMAVAEAPIVPPAPPPAPDAMNPAPPALPPAGSFPTEKARLEASLTRFMAVADGYPKTQAGIAARYEAAATLAALGRTAEAMQRYQEVIDRAPASIYADTARLGLGEAQLRAGQYDAAAATFKSVAALKDGRMPIDGVLMQLGRAYALAGKAADARQTFQRIVDEFPQSSYAALARRELDSAKTTG